MSNAWSIALNTLRDLLRRKLAHVVVLLAVVAALLTALPMAYMNMAAEAGEADTVISIKAYIVQIVTLIWYEACKVIALIFGVTAISGEVQSGTIVPVLARPVDRWELLFGKWLGLKLFALPLLAIGVAAGWTVALGLGFHPTALFWVGMLQLFVSLVVVGTISVSLGAITSPIVGGLLTCLLVWFLPAAPLKQFLEHPKWYAELGARLACYITPATIDDELITSSLTQELLHPKYGRYFRVFSENLLYGAAWFGIAMLRFRRRELNFRASH